MDINFFKIVDKPLPLTSLEEISNTNKYQDSMLYKNRRPV